MIAGIKMLLAPLGIFFFCLFCIDSRERFILVLKSYTVRVLEKQCNQKHGHG